MNKELFDDHISQGIALMNARNYSAAKEEFEAAINIDLKSVEAYIHLGNACANLGEYNNSLEMFKKALLIEPTSGEILYSIGNIYLLQDERIKAVEYYNRAEDSGFENAELYQMLAGVFLDAGDVSQALRNITKAISAAPFDGELRLIKARMYLAENKLHEALETLDEMQKILPDAFEAYDLRSQIYCSMEQYEKALDICNDGCDRFPEDPNLSLAKLKVLVGMHKDDDAIMLIAEMKENGQFEQVLKEASMQEAIIYLKKRNNEKAVESLNLVIEKIGKSADILYLLLDIYSKNAMYEKALDTAEALIEMKPGDFYESTAKYLRAFALDKLGKKEEAKGEFQKLVSQFRKMTIETPSFYEGYIYRLLVHTNLGEYEKALELSDYIENLYPERADAHMFRYYIYKEQGDKEKAETEKQLAQKMNAEIIL